MSDESSVLTDKTMPTCQAFLFEKKRPCGKPAPYQVDYSDSPANGHSYQCRWHAHYFVSPHRRRHLADLN